MGSVERREAACTDVQVVRTGAEAAGATLVEISIYGCHIACPIDADIDEVVRLSLSGSLPIVAHVVWNRDGMVGCRFDTPIGRPLLRSLTIR